MLKVELLGKFSVQVDGRPIERWPRHDAAQLLKLLAVQLGHHAPRHKINDALWLQIDTSVKPESRLNNALYVLRKALEPDRATRAESRYVNAAGDLIALDPAAEVWIDIDHFERLLDIGMVDDNSTAELTEAIALYKGPLLPQDEGQPWSTQPRQHLEQRYIGALRALSRRQLAQGLDEAAIATLQRLTRVLPTEEGAHRELIGLFVRAGRQQEAQRQYDQCREALASELGVAPDPRTREALLGAPEPGANPEARRPPPASGGDSHPRFAPPILLQPLIDREREVERACRLFRTGHRLVTLSGPAGVGKTQLAIRVANELCGEFEHGACFVSLSEITDPLAVPGAIGRALGLKQTMPNTWEELLKGFAAKHHLLLVLDNFEHLLGAAPLVSGLIAVGVRLRVLCTSRAALNVAGETLLGVPPLQLPPHEPRPLEELEQVASVALLVQRAQAAEPEFRLTDANAAAIVALSRRLDGLPLAIELAAARVKLFGTEELRRRLELSFDLLHRGRRDSPERHHSLEAVLQWGYQLLPVGVQRAFNWLGLFAGGVTLASARSVLDGEGDAESHGDAVVDALELLLEHHLIGLADAEHHDRGTRRYRMLQTVRAFALDQLRRSLDDAQARARFAQHWLAQAERIASERSAGRADEACATFEAEHGNFEIAVAWAAEHDTRSAHRFVAALAPFWAMRGFGAEGRRWVQAIMPTPGAGSATPDANASYAAAELLLNLGYYIEAMPHALAALKEARRVGTACRMVDSLRLVGHLDAMMGRWKQATSVFRQALQHSLTLGDAAITACRNSLGTLLRHQGEYDEAHGHFEQALAKIESVSAAMAAGILFNLSLLARLRGRYADARELCAQAVARARASHDLRKLGCVLVDHGELMLLTGSVDDGVAAIDEALEINKRVGDSFLAGCALQQKGAAAVLRGRAGQGRELLTQSLRVHREACCGDQADITLLWLVRACWLDRSPDEAAGHFAALLQLGQKIRHYLLPSVLEEGARLLQHRGQLPQAGLALAQSRAMRERFGLLRTPAEEGAALASLRELQAALGPARWQELANGAQPIDADAPLRLLEDCLPRPLAVDSA